MSNRDIQVSRPPDPRHSQDYRRLKWRRRAARLSLTEAANLAKCSKSHLSKLEHDQDSASPDLLGRLADAYECHITDLMQPEPGTVSESPEAPAEVEGAAA